MKRESDVSRVVDNSRSTGKTSADAVASWLRNTLSATRGMGVKFLSLAPHDTAEPIDCEMFAWGSWSNWSEWSDCVDNTQTRTNYVMAM